MGGHRDLRSRGITDCPVTTITVTHCDGRDSTDVRYPPYLYRPMTQVVRLQGYAGELLWFWACLDLLPALIAAVCCEWVGRVKDRAGARLA
jgi:hypothetical protein